MLAYAQTPAPQTQIPETASIKLSNPGVAIPGQKLVIQFVLDRAPVGYAGAKLDWVFWNQHPLAEEQS